MTGSSEFETLNINRWLTGGTYAFTTTERVSAVFVTSCIYNLTFLSFFGCSLVMRALDWIQLAQG